MRQHQLAAQGIGQALGNTDIHHLAMEALRRVATVKQYGAGIAGAARQFVAAVLGRPFHQHAHGLEEASEMVLGLAHPPGTREPEGREIGLQADARVVIPIRPEARSASILAISIIHQARAFP